VKKRVEVARVGSGAGAYVSLLMQFPNLRYLSCLAVPCLVKKRVEIERLGSGAGAYFSPLEQFPFFCFFAYKKGPLCQGAETCTKAKPCHTVPAGFLLPADWAPAEPGAHALRRLLVCAVPAGISPGP
jgi:hypothetical protein